MCKLFDEWSDEIERYCIDNNFSFEKARKLSQCWGKNDLVLQHYDKELGKNGLLDETPMPVVLWIKRDSEGKLIFEETEFTKKYIGIGKVS
ncbi:hypothetical protein [Ruminococcus sp. HUN007]|uniref:hypothetical protein n=1 Tax=Ruminococcus sp. HUN007 TaxID=1514668 RepID=UPI0005D26F7F|nr:hypothetical protein [Ruminococcus sp. HUN007]